MKKSKLLLPAIGLCLQPLHAEVIASSTFSSAASTDGWSAVANTEITSGQADTAFAAPPYLRAASISGAPAGNNTRASLAFPATTLDETDEYLEVSFQLRIASSYASSADRRFQTCFWDSGTSDGYLAYVRAAGTNITSQFVKQANVPATGIMNSGGTSIAATGDTTQPLGSSQTVVHNITYRLLKTEAGLELRFTGTDDTAVVRTITATDSTTPFQVFDRLDLTMWGSTVNFHIDNVEVTTGIYVPPPPDGVWDGEGTDSNWSTPENWADDTLPTAGSSLVFGPAESETGVNDLPEGTAFNNLTFTEGAIFYDLTGNPVTLSGRIENGAPLGQTLALPVILGANVALEATAGDLYLESDISGDFGLVKGGAQLALLMGNNSFTGPIVVNRGRVELENDQTGITGGYSVNNTAASTVGIAFGAQAAVAEGKEILVGTTTSGTAAATLEVNGELTNEGELKGLRGSLINVTGTFTQTGPARLEAVGGYSATMNIFPGGSFVFDGEDTFKLNSAPTNFAPATVKIDSGTFTTNRGFANTTAVTTSTTAGLTLSYDGILKLSADIPDLLTAAVPGSAVFQMGPVGGTVDTNGFSATLNLPVQGEGALTKSGAGNFTTTGTNTYTGDTIVLEGTLSLAGPNLANESYIEIEEGAVLNLDFDGEDTVAGLILGGISLGPGNYSHATHPEMITGDGVLVVANPDPYTDWIETFTSLTEPADKEKSADPDKDGLSNLVEFALDGDPAKGSASGKMKSGIEGGILTITLPVLADAAFTGSGPMTAETGGYTYRIDGGTDLDGFTAGVEEITALSEDLPELTDGWIYKTFRLTTASSSAPKGFLRADVSETQ